MKKLPKIRDVISERDKLANELRDVISERDKLTNELSRLLRELGEFPPGHFHSPIPSLEEVRRDLINIFGDVPRTLPGINLSEAEQITLTYGVNSILQQHAISIPCDAKFALLF